MKTLQGLNEVTLLESIEDCEAFLNSYDRSVHIHHGKIYENGTMVAITIKAYQRLFLDIYP